MKKIIFLLKLLSIIVFCYSCENDRININNINAPKGVGEFKVHYKYSKTPLSDWFKDFDYEKIFDINGVTKYSIRNFKVPSKNYKRINLNVYYVDGVLSSIYLLGYNESIDKIAEELKVLYPDFEGGPSIFKNNYSYKWRGGISMDKLIETSYKKTSITIMTMTQTTNELSFINPENEAFIESIEKEYFERRKRDGEKNDKSVY